MGAHAHVRVASCDLILNLATNPTPEVQKFIDSVSEDRYKLKGFCLKLGFKTVCFDGDRLCALNLLYLSI